MGTEAWKAMEALATRMTNTRIREEKKRLEKLEKLRKFNKEHPVVPVAQVEIKVVVYNSESVEPPKIDPITYNPAWYVLNYLAPDRKKKKK